MVMDSGSKLCPKPHHCMDEVITIGMAAYPGLLRHLRSSVAEEVPFLDVSHPKWGGSWTVPERSWGYELAHAEKYGWWNTKAEDKPERVLNSLVNTEEKELGHGGKEREELGVTEMS